MVLRILRSSKYIKNALSNLCIWFGSCEDRRLNQSRSTTVIPGWARREERLSWSEWYQPFRIDSDAVLHMNLIHWIWFGSCEVRRVSRALVVGPLSYLSDLILVLFSQAVKFVTVREFDWLKPGLQTGKGIKFRLRQITYLLATDTAKFCSISSNNCHVISCISHQHLRACLKHPVRTHLILGKKKTTKIWRWPLPWSLWG